MRLELIWRLVKEMKFLARLEANCLAWSNGDFSTCSGVAANAGLTRLDGEDAEAAQLDAVARNEGLLHAVEYGVNRRFCFGSWQSGTLNNPLYKILLNHLGRRPWAVIFRKMVLTGFSNVMVESRDEIVNDRTLP
jgi:hypothetical protein